MNNLDNIIKSLQYIKNKKIPKEDALDYLEFDGYDYPSKELLLKALEIVYKI